MTAKTYDRQTGKFLAKVAENMPEMSDQIMQGWIENPKALQRFLEGLCPPDEVTANIILIDRTQPFDLVKFLGKEWTIEEEDEHALALTQVDISRIQLKNMLKKGENRIKGEEKLKRLKEADYIRLDTKVFQVLWEKQTLIPESWKKKTNGNTTFIFFDGTVLRNPLGNRYVLFLCWNGGEWYWSYYWLELDWPVFDPSAVLASI